VGALIALPGVLFVSVENFGKDVHFVVVESVNVPRKVIDVKRNFLSDLKICNFKHKPKSITSSVSVWFH
tara:strand:+ start:834 stop:1040 length:207 start_codon:yes stop_codon:yes gene_type:complete